MVEGPVETGIESLVWGLKFCTEGIFVGLEWRDGINILMARGGDGEGEILGYKTSSHSLAYPSGVFESHLYYSKRVRVIL